MQGDALTLWVLWPGFAMAALMGAIPAARGWPRNTLLFLGLAFAAVAAWLWFKPDVSPWIIAVLHSYAWLPVVTVSIVSLMVHQEKRPGATAVEQPPASVAGAQWAASPESFSKWAPDFSTADVMVYVGTQSKWSVNRNATIADVRTLLVIALQQGKITAWAKDHPQESVEVQIRPYAWMNAEFNVDTGYAFFAGYGAAHDVRFSSGEIRSAWPPKS